MESFETLNADFIDAQYKRWKSAPDTLPKDWQFFFKGFEIALTRTVGSPAGSDGIDALKQARVEALTYRYRDMGHLLACMDPLSACPTDHPLLNVDAFDLEITDLQTEFYTDLFPGQAQASLKAIIGALKEIYARSIGVEYMHLQDPAERAWLQERMEPQRNKARLSAEEKLQIYDKLCQSGLFEAFLNKKYLGVTRFSLEGGDAVIPALDLVFRRAAGSGVREVILGMAHRGRLNVQAHVLGKSYYEIFSEFESCYDPDHLVGSGDVKYHNGYLAELRYAGQAQLLAYLVNNPSHLEAVNPVVEGMARARQDLLGHSGQLRVLPILLHGDAAFAGQGIVAETLNMSQLKGYGTGGTLHLIINNQIGYTTLPEDSRSTRYSTDVAKMLMVPVFHVHGEDPEAVAQVVRMAVDYRNAFGKDVVIDLVCFRRYGHNEGDEPYFTQPLMYDRIKARPSLYVLYGEKLLEEGVLTAARQKEIQSRIENQLQTDYDEVHGSACPFPEDRYFDDWERISGRYAETVPATRVAAETLVALGNKLNTPPTTMAPHPKVKLLLDRRHKALASGTGIDWANAEALAFGSLVTEGHFVRLSGQDCGRGTFSQRHSVLFDRQSGDRFIPLNHLADDQAPFDVINSLLAEVSVLGFEYGYSVTRPDGLVLWEAQFGDFANNAQTVIDLFIAAGQAKWQRLSGLVLLLPHGWEGLGPEHSSARLERFLQLCAKENMIVCNLTTPAQYFHCLRRQVIAPWRKPLVIMSPKSLLRHPKAVSTVEDFSTRDFATILDDPRPPKKARKVLLCSGKVYYQLLQRREELNAKEIAIVRLEQLHPFPEAALQKIFKRYGRSAEWVWVQEEPRNMGAWDFLRGRIAAVIGKHVAYVGREAAASPATGFPRIYQKEQSGITDTAVGAVAEGAGVAG
ncbi:MAG: 2-oxoglutarate dehydrogenase E1 component [Desulfosarcinaceae bacterium]|nr:2-oxoglutarate dehydrogenase E1 component [Desulfosarcinaceae bacterium]